MTDSPAGDQPLVSIITAFYSRAAYADSSVGSLIDQSYPNLEVFVVDDGSTDDTKAKLEKFNDPCLRIIRQDNAIFGVYNPRWGGVTTGEFVDVHDVGDISGTDSVAEQVRLSLARREVGVVGRLVEDDSNVSDAINVVRPPDGLPFFETLCKRGPFTHGEVMARRSLYEQAGGYRACFRFAGPRPLNAAVAAHGLRDRAAAALPSREYLRRGLDQLGQVGAAGLSLRRRGAMRRGPRRRMGDLLDRHGHLAPFLRKRSRAVARRIGRLGARMMVTGELGAGWKLVQSARAEFLSRRVALIWGLAAFHRIPRFGERSVGRPC